MDGGSPVKRLWIRWGYKHQQLGTADFRITGNICCLFSAVTWRLHLQNCLGFIIASLQYRTCG